MGEDGIDMTDQKEFIVTIELKITYKTPVFARDEEQAKANVRSNASTVRFSRVIEDWEILDISAEQTDYKYEEDDHE